MTSDARASQLIRDYFSREWPRVCPDATFAVDGSPAPRDEVFVHLTVDCDPGWVHLRCWVPRVLQVTATLELHRAARALFENASIPSDDGHIKFGQGERADIGRDGRGKRWWMSVISFPFALVSGATRA